MNQQDVQDPALLTNVPFDGIANFRDVGVSVNTFLGKRVLREGVLFRSARPDNASPSDIDRLVSEFGIRTVLDLRTNTEYRQQNNKPSGDPRRARPRVPIDIPNANRVHVPLTGTPYRIALVRQLSFFSFLRFLFLLITFRKAEATRFLAAEVMIPQGLQGGSNLTLKASRAAVALGLCAIADSIAGNGGGSGKVGVGVGVGQGRERPVLVHCTSGKDRTGTMTMLVLMLCRVPLAAIEHDYLATSRSGALHADWSERLEELRELGFPESWLGTPEDLVRETHRFLQDHWGGVDGYCDWIGFGEDKRRRLVEALLV